MKMRFAALAVLFALAGCHNQPTAGGVSPEDERELDNAAAMLEQRNVFDASSDSLGANGMEAVQANGAAPANGTGNAR